MEQYKYLKQLLHLPKLPSITIKDIKLDNSETLMIATTVLTIFNLFGILHPITVLLLGFILPLYCYRIDIYVSKYYVEVLAVLLWVRLWSDTLSSIDGIFLIALWHPNILLAEKIMGWVKKTITGQKTSTIDKLGQKIDKLF